MNLIDRYCRRTTFASDLEFQRDFAVNIPANFNFAYDVVDRLATEAPDQLALLWCDEDGRERRLTFAEMRQWSNRAAQAFRHLGIGKGDAVILLLKGRCQFWFALLGLHRLGAIAIPATHLLKAKDLVYRFERAKVRLAVAIDDPQLTQEIAVANRTCAAPPQVALIERTSQIGVDFDALMAAAPDTFARPIGPTATANHDPSLLYFTSGTTGLPKMVCHDFTYPLGHLATARFWQNVGEGDLHFTMADSGWAKAVWGKIYGQWLCGGAVFVYDYERFVPEHVLAKIAHYNVTTFCAPPTVYRFLVLEDFGRHDLSRLRHCVVAGEPLTPELFELFKKKTGLELREGYGQTETPLLIGTFAWMPARPGSMGRPVPGYGVKLVEADGNECPPGQEGEIVLDIRDRHPRPPGLFTGYLEATDNAPPAWQDGLYRTGDIARRDTDGYYWFIGRADDVIKSSGYRIGPFEVESALLQHPAVHECAVTAAPDALRGQVVKATIVCASGYQPSEHLVHQLQAHVRETTAPYKYPRLIDFVDSLPKTISGKIRRVELRQENSGRPALESGANGAIVPR